MSFAVAERPHVCALLVLLLTPKEVSMFLGWWQKIKRVIRLNLHIMNFFYVHALLLKDLL